MKTHTASVTRNLISAQGTANRIPVHPVVLHLRTKGTQRDIVPGGPGHEAGITQGLKKKQSIGRLEEKVV